MPDATPASPSGQAPRQNAPATRPSSGSEKETSSGEIPPSNAQQQLNDPVEKPENNPNYTHKSPSVDQHRDIQYHYLTFDTALPSPTGISIPRPDQQPVPECPDLRPYISPFTWGSSRKWVITAISCVVTSLSAIAAGAYSPAEKTLTEKWGISGVVYNLGITLFTFGFAISPMVLAPFSEINGRRPMFICSGILFSVAQLATYSSIIGGVLSDIYVTEERNTPMALFSGAVLFGTGLGPMMSGFIVYHISWRWIFYLQTIVAAVSTVVVWIFFNETRGSVLLSRKAAVLNKWYEKLEEAGYVGVDMPVAGANGDGAVRRQSQRIRWKVKADEERESILKVVTVSLYRPFHLLFTEPVVFFFSLWVAFSWAVLYLQFGSIPLVFQTNHGFNIQQSGAVFASICIGAIIATIVSIWQEKFVRRLGKISSTPEGRLYFVCIESILMPAGMFWFGWTSFSSVHWIVPCFAVGCATIGIFSIYLAVFNYLADTYHRYASSALAAQSFCRNILGGIFPLVGSILTIVPWVLVFYGPKIRARSKIASEIMTEEERA
ncbi:hypothetical protein FQN50_004075 [Emmonsiellopsis sp. PD_5]|nr:hypothetical protein FQN50_004075 [Emmonsiellopsis sp. PD_5]